MNVTIAHNLKILREAASYTQDEMAQTIGITLSAYRDYESGVCELPYDILEKASDILGCDMTSILEKNGNIDYPDLKSTLHIEGITPEDVCEIIRFNDIVKSYLKMEAIGCGKPF